MFQFSLPSFGEIVRHHADPNEDAAQQLPGEALPEEREKTTQVVASWDSPVPSTTYLTTTLGRNLGLPDSACAHLLPQAEISKVDTGSDAAKKGKNNEEQEQLANKSLLPGPHNVQATQIDSATIPEVHSIATSSDEEHELVNERTQDGHNSEATSLLADRVL